MMIIDHLLNLHDSMQLLGNRRYHRIHQLCKIHFAKPTVPGGAVMGVSSTSVSNSSGPNLKLLMSRIYKIKMASPMAAKVAKGQMQRTVISPDILCRQMVLCSDNSGLARRNISAN